ncbi:hypothetical protein ACIOHH_09865 [Streptomyces microflavus]|uniref:preATP grasp domain-containing protein n=1 Tax=Streptomyces microflavus TaxID=1919 RepID=UPI00380CC999
MAHPTRGRTDHPSPFRRYVFHLLGVPENSVDVITVPDTPYLPMAQALAEHNLLEPLRALVAERPTARLLPTALDEASAALATDLRIPAVPYETGIPSPGTLRAVAPMNTKSGFRTVAQSLGLRLPHGRASTGAELGQVTTALPASHQRVVLKTDRSADGHGLHFVSHGDQPSHSPPPADSHWVVEEYVEHTRAISAQGHANGYPGGGGMRWRDAHERRLMRRILLAPAGSAREGTRGADRLDPALGGHLAAEGYRGPGSLDLVCTQDGTLYALE